MYGCPLKGINNSSLLVYFELLLSCMAAHGCAACANCVWKLCILSGCIRGAAVPLLLPHKLLSSPPFLFFELISFSNVCFQQGICEKGKKWSTNDFVD